TWADLTGGEIFLRPDIDDVLELVVLGWRRLALLHFPPNGFLTDRIVRSTERIAGQGPSQLIVTVSVDGDEALNDEIRGVKGGFRRQMQTFNALRRVPGVSVAIGVTLSSHNAGQFERTSSACARECAGLTPDDVHLNVAQRSTHYYGNDGTTELAPSASATRSEMRFYRAMRSPARSPRQLLE